MLREKSSYKVLSQRHFCDAIKIPYDILHEQNSGIFWIISPKMLFQGDTFWKDSLKVKSPKFLFNFLLFFDSNSPKFLILTSFSDTLASCHFDVICYIMKTFSYNKEIQRQVILSNISDK